MTPPRTSDSAADTPSLAAQTSTPAERDAAFRESLTLLLARYAMTITVAGFVVILLSMLVESAAGLADRATTAMRAGTLVLLAACVATFWREPSPGRAIAHATVVLCALMLLTCAVVLRTGGMRGDLFGALYLVLVLPAILIWRPRAIAVLTAALAAPACATAVVISDSAPEGASRVALLLGTALFGFLVSRTSYAARRREFDATLELQDANRSLVAAQAHLVQTDKLSALGTLSACIAHELAQPLTLMTGYTGVLASKLAKGVPDEDELVNQRRQVETMRRATSRMVTIVDHLRRFGRRSGRARPVELNDVVQGALLFLESELQRASVELTLELTEEPARVWSDQNELEQIALNLLMNARDVLRDRPGARIVVRTRVVGDEVSLEVQDNGPGVLPEMREQLFQPFVTSKGEGRGMGLGLWVSRSIARNWGGQLRYEDAAGAGSIFCLTLPRTDADPNPSSGPASGAVLTPAPRPPRTRP